MKYTVNVIHNGELYPAGAEVPTGECSEEKNESESVVDPEKPKRGRKPKSD